MCALSSSSKTVSGLMHGKIGLPSRPGNALVISIVVTVLPGEALHPAGIPSFSEIFQCEPCAAEVAATKYMCAGKLGPWLLWRTSSAKAYWEASDVYWGTWEAST